MSTHTTAGTEAAGLLRRLAAMSYDALILVSIFLLLTIAIMLSLGWREIAPGTWWFQLTLLAVFVLFFCGFWTHGGQTLGMLAWKIRVERTDGSPLRWRDALLRLLASFVSLIPLGLGYLWCLVDRDKRSWHDRLSRTRVVRVR